MLHTCNHTIKLIVLYGSEILTVKFSNNVEKYINREIDSLTVEKIHTKSCKYVLGVRNSSSNDDAVESLDVYQFYIQFS